MEQIVVKTEVQSNGEILLYYVDENGESQEGVLTAIENTEHNEHPLEDNSYVLGSYGDLEDQPLEEQSNHKELPEAWSEEDHKRLLLFYNDNKNSFTSGLYVPRQLWAVACKTMLVGQTPESCEEQLNELKQKYCEVCTFIKQGIYIKWPFLNLCHQAFHDDPSVARIGENLLVSSEQESEAPNITIITNEKLKNTEKEGTLSIKQVYAKAKPADVKVENMLKLYLKYKDKYQKDHNRQDLWDIIAQELGEYNGEYYQKRFFNFKRHYISLLIKKREENAAINWPYMDLFDKIYGDDVAFHKKNFNVDIKLCDSDMDQKIEVPEHEWNDVQMLILAKYYFDSYDEFQDETIPNKFLWTEVGRLIEKKPETCEIKYEMLHREHLDNIINTNYSMGNRTSIAIIFDYTIAKDVRNELTNTDKETNEIPWKSEEADELVQFIYDKIELFKDPEGHFVCWAAVARKIKKPVSNCKKMWDELVKLYVSILEDKKENSDMQIDWRYIELFDRIFDYGMDVNLLNGYKAIKPSTKQNLAEKVTVKKIVFGSDKKDKPEEQNEGKSDQKVSNTEPKTDPRSSKILEFYLKNKDRFQMYQSDLSLWEPLSKKIGLTITQCGHRFRILKETYIEYVKKELENPKTLVKWPYFTLCKKVFGYRMIRAKLKEGVSNMDNEDWRAREIKHLISFFSKNFHNISNNIEDVSQWAPLASDLGKSEINCREKFIELRKCYRKLKTMQTRNPDVKISWSYFNMFDRIYSLNEVDGMEVEVLEDEYMEGAEVVQEMELDAGNEAGEDDFQCIIVLQEGEELPTNMEGQIIVQQSSDENNFQTSNEELNTTDQTVNKPSKWTKRTKKRLLINYINYIRSHRGPEIKSSDMWAEIATKFPDKNAVSCRKMFLKMKSNFKQSDDMTKSSNPYASLLTKALKLKPKFVKTQKQQQKLYKDVRMDPEKVQLALSYYLEHIEEFVNPKFEKKYLWTQLANHVSEPVTKIYNKINYLKQAFNIDTEEIAGQVTEFSPIMKEIVSKEVAVTLVLDLNPNPQFDDQEVSWLDDEIEQLLLWYLSNLEMFKNPKFNKSYLWMEASTILRKSPLVCSKKMIEIRSLYRNMVKDNAEGLKDWRFFELCQKIYGTGKKTVAENL